MQPLESGHIEDVHIGTPLSPNVACKRGESGLAAWIIDDFFPPDDQYCTLLDPSTRTGCGPAGLLLSTAHVQLCFMAACTFDVGVAIVGASQISPGCYKPNPLAVICPPVAYPIGVPNPGAYDIGMALPAACCITQPAFLCVIVNSFGGCPNTSTGRPALLATASCTSCESWNIYPGGIDEWCSIPFSPPVGNPIMYTDADCCQVTPTREGTWGRLETLYR